MPKQPKTYLSFAQIASFGKTHVFAVFNKTDTDPIGRIKWKPLWRKYCFYPYDETVWDANCLTEVTAFLTKLMDDRKVLACKHTVEYDFYPEHPKYHGFCPKCKKNLTFEEIEELDENENPN